MFQYDYRACEGALSGNYIVVCTSASPVEIAAGSAVWTDVGRLHSSPRAAQQAAQLERLLEKFATVETLGHCAACDDGLLEGHTACTTSPRLREAEAAGTDGTTEYRDGAWRTRVPATPEEMLWMARAARAHGELTRLEFTAVRAELRRRMAAEAS